MTCPKCYRPAERSKTLITGDTVFRCKPCNLFTVKDGSRWIPDGPPLVAALRFLAQIRDDDAERQRQIMESDISDPRWTQL
ncbi:MAG TPA: hypothetical protein VG815_13500 [Chloroflexota bacterium]|nr:hypothetical protein [Chloroflexota bacterium]